LPYALQHCWFAVGEIIEHDNVISGGKQFHTGMAANKARASGYKYFLPHGLDFSRFCAVQPNHNA
jgi:hypothetical protein